MKERWLAGINDLKRDIKEAPGPWIAAAAVLLFVIFRWGKKILGLDSLGITTDYPAVSGMAVMMLVLSGIALAVILCYVLRTKEFRLDKMYLRCGLLLGALYLFILPPLSAPDEWVHYVTAYKVSNQILGMEVLDEKGEVLVQEEEMQANDGAFPDAEQYHYFWEHYLGKETGDEMVSSGKGPNGYYMLPYLPQAVGITVARVLNLNFATRILFGRICNLVWAVVAIALAIRWMPFGKKILFGVGMLPMALHELASNSYDAWIIAFSMMFIAYCLKLAYEKTSVDKRDIAVLAVLIALLAPCKVVYAPLIGLCLLIPKEKFGNTKRWVISATIVLGAVVVIMLLLNGRILGSYVTEDTSDHIIGWAGEPGYTISYFLEHPMEYPKIIWNTLTIGDMGLVKNYVQDMLGRVLGWLDQNLKMPQMYYWSLVILLLGHFVSVDGESKVFRRGNKLWMVVLIAAIFLLVLTSMLLSHTPISQAHVHGVQGRYFLPILPMIGLVVFKDGGLVIKKDRQKFLSAAYAVFHVLLMAQLFGQVITVHLVG